jgi:hypothetical protein
VYILTTEVLNKLMNSSLIKTIYPMVDKIETKVELVDNDPVDPIYKIRLNIYLNDDTINHINMYKKGMDPHYLVDRHMIDMLKMLNISSREILQVHLLVRNPKGKLVYPYE